MGAHFPVDRDWHCLADHSEMHGATERFLTDSVSVWGPPAGPDRYRDIFANAAEKRIAGMKADRTVARLERNFRLVANLDERIASAQAALNETRNPGIPGWLAAERERDERGLFVSAKS